MPLDYTTLDWKPTRHPGVFLFPLYRNAESSDSVLLIRMDPGCGYPRHRHRDVERVLVVAGGYRDEEGVHSTGDWIENPPGSVHSPVALEGAEPCVLLAVAVGGIELLDRS